MDTNTFTQLVQLGAAGAVIIVVGLFLKFISQERALDRSMWGEHLGNTVRVLEKVSLQVDVLINANAQNAMSQRFRDELTAVTLKRKDNLHDGERPATDKEIA